MPSAQSASHPAARPAANPRSRKRSRVVLLLLAACFFAPVMLAWLFQSPFLNYTPVATKNFGELISPVVALKFGGAVLQQAKASNAEAQWRLLYLPESTCGSCTARLDLLAHLKQATGREMHRVNLEVWSDAGFTLPPAQAGFTVRAWNPSELAQWRAQLGLQSGGLLLVDPLGNAMMRYPIDFDGSKVRKDLQRLLRASQVGKSQSSGIIS